MSEDSFRKVPALIAVAVAAIALCAVSFYVLTDTQDEPAQNTVEIPDWLAEGADYAEKIYRTGDQSQGYDFVVHYKNGNIKSVFCKQEGQEFTPRELPKNSIDVTCGPS